MEKLLERSTQQRLTALEQANRIRSYRADRKKDVHAGRLPPDWFIRHARLNSDLGSMRVMDALQTIPHFGPAKTQRVLQKVGVSPKRTLGGLTAGQHARIQAALREYERLRLRIAEWTP